MEGKWVFGIYERGTKKLLLFPVDKRNSQTLTPIIRRHVLPGTTIYSDEWCAYSKLAVRTCNSHNKGFVSITGATHKTLNALGVTVLVNSTRTQILY